LADGTGHIPIINQIKNMSPDDWECFIEEWMTTKEADYFDFERLGGAGDQGRDVVGFIDDPVDNKEYEWDNYQCKHYSSPLSPSMIWSEIGKVCFYSYKKEYPFPRKYYSVAPMGVGTKLSNLLRTPRKLKEELYANWERYCAKGITETVESVVLDSSLKTYIDGLDFSVFDKTKPITVIQEHSETRFHSVRFDVPLPKRPPVPNVPEDVPQDELTYVNKLVQAYSEHSGEKLMNIDDVKENKNYSQHFKRFRESFGHAESLRNFSRDNLPNGMFLGLQDEILDGIIDVVDVEKLNGFDNVKKAVSTSKLLQISRTKLSIVVTVNDRGGICHQLANDDLIDWSRNG
jgi:hypothetical protein